MCDDDECVVCFCRTTNALVPCGHSVCPTCASRWLCTTASCPLCRGAVASMSGATPRPRRMAGVLHVVLRFDDDEVPRHIGVALSTSGGHCGVVVERLNARCLARRSGLCVGDVITHINDILVEEHRSAIAIIDCAREHRIPLVVRIRLPRKSSWPTLFQWLAACLAPR